MSKDMKIYPYRNESDESFVYRLCFSALGQWCLMTGRNQNGNEIGTTKHNQTLVLNELLSRYCALCPAIAECFIDVSSKQDFAVFVRRVYEETGYLLTNHQNHNSLANFGRSIQLGKKALFFGVPNDDYEVNGLGVFASPTAYKVAINDFLIRDNLTCEEYFHACFDEIDFYDRSIDVNDLEIFDPLSSKTPSRSWTKKIMTDYTMARNVDTNSYYRIIRTPTGILYANERFEIQSDSFTSHEYRRLYFALKKHYGNPLKAWITKVDDEYSKVRVRGHLPYREYYCLLLLAWPERSAFDKVNFLVNNALLADVISLLENIGIKVEREHT